MTETDEMVPSGSEAEESFDVDAWLALPEEQHGSDHGTPEEGEAEATRAAPQVLPIKSDCLRDFHAIHSSGTRALSQIRLVVIHSTESNSARSSAEWFTNPKSGGSAHIVVDDFACYRTLDNDTIPWGAPGANTNGFHVEHTGWAKKWARADWMRHENTLRRGAFKSALHAVRFGIPVKVLTASDLRRGRAGFVTHATVTEFYPSEGNHTDPGPGFPLDHYMALVQQYVNELNV